MCDKFIDFDSQLMIVADPLSKAKANPKKKAKKTIALTKNSTRSFTSASPL